MSKRKFSRLNWVLEKGCNGKTGDSSVLNNYKNYLEENETFEESPRIAIVPKWVKSFEAKRVYEITVSERAVKNSFKLLDLSLCNWVTPTERIAHPQFTPAKARIQVIGDKRTEISEITGLPYKTDVLTSYTYPFGMGSNPNDSYYSVAKKIEDSVKQNNYLNKVTFEVELWRSSQ